MRMFGYFILVILDVYALFLGLYLHKSFLFSCGVLPAPPTEMRVPPKKKRPHPCGRFSGAVFCWG